MDQQASRQIYEAEHNAICRLLNAHQDLYDPLWREPASVRARNYLPHDLIKWARTRHSLSARYQEWGGTPIMSYVLPPHILHCAVQRPVSLPNNVGDIPPGSRTHYRLRAATLEDLL